MRTMSTSRIVSLLPSATEIVFALGLGEALVGVTHECDFPPAARSKRAVTKSYIPDGSDSATIDHLVSEHQGRLYAIDEAALAELKPTVILTQRLCDVCAVPYDEVAAVAERLNPRPLVVNLEPTSLEDVVSSIEQVAQAVGAPERAEPVVAALQARIEAVRVGAWGGTHRPGVVCLEWADPPFCAGHWVPGMVEMAGGVEALGAPGVDSRRVKWEQVVAAQPEVLVCMFCGFDVPRSLDDVRQLAQRPEWKGLPAVQRGDIWVTHGSAYFSRPGPRLVDGLELLAQILHPEVFPRRFGDEQAVRFTPVAEPALASPARGG